jgi:peptidyl-prolyl cis-trans isomerase C
VSSFIGCDSSDSIGKVGGEAISKAEYEAYLKLKNIPINDTERYERMKDQYLQRAALAAAIEGSGKLDVVLTEAEVDEFKKQILISRYFETYLNDSVSDDGIQNYYSNNPDAFQSEQVHVAHILFRVNPNMDESERQAVLTTAHEAYSKIQAGQDFADVAKASSEDKVSAERGGDLGWIVKGAVAPEFSEQAFALSKGNVSEPFLTSFGFHIIKVLDDPQTVKKPLEAVKGDIRYQLRNNAKQAETERLMDTIKYEVNSAN